MGLITYPKCPGDPILKLLSENNTLTTATLSSEIGISPKAVEKHLANLKKDGLLKRIGPDKGGHWEVVKNEKSQLKR